eukprot:9177754-Prorocentrum_lima.AAC.1
MPIGWRSNGSRGNPALGAFPALCISTPACLIRCTFPCHRLPRFLRGASSALQAHSPSPTAGWN